MDGRPTSRIGDNTPKSLFIGCVSFESVTIQEHCPAGKRHNHGMKFRGCQALLAKAKGITMLRHFLHPNKHMLIVAMCLSSCAINGCVDSRNYLASDSRLPKWFTLPSGLTRADVMVARDSMVPTQRGVDIKVILYDKKYKTLAEVSGRSVLLGYFRINVVNGVPEITGYKAQIDEHGNRIPYFYVVDDPALKRKLLDEYEKKLLDENGIDYPALRKKLLDEN